MSERSKIIIYKTVPQAGIETVEKRGLGHPDALCDALAEHVSAAFARYCFEQFGSIAHYNIEGLTMDEGESNVQFGGGEMIKPIRLHLRGSFPCQHDGKKIPYMDIAKETIYDYLKKVVPQLDAHKWVRIIDGTRAYGVARKTYDITNLVANHMYTVSATYPPYAAESCALRIEQKLNSPAYKKDHPYVGSDNKIIVVQNGNSVDIDSYVSMVSGNVADADALRSYTEVIKHDICEVAATDRVRVDEIGVYTSVNPLHDGRVMTVSGSSVESYNGCAIGRSRYPIYHAAKIYYALAYQISKRIYNEERVASAVKLTSKVGWAMESPWHTDINLLSDKGSGLISQPLLLRVEEIANEEFGHIEDIVKTLMYGKT
jgi:S-adenosylmethionine synthetase